MNGQIKPALKSITAYLSAPPMKPYEAPENVRGVALQTNSQPRIFRIPKAYVHTLHGRTGSSFA